MRVGIVAGRFCSLPLTVIAADDPPRAQPSGAAVAVKRDGVVAVDHHRNNISSAAKVRRQVVGIELWRTDEEPRRTMTERPPVDDQPIPCVGEQMQHRVRRRIGRKIESPAKQRVPVPALPGGIDPDECRRRGVHTVHCSLSSRHFNTTMSIPELILEEGPAYSRLSTGSI